MMEFSELESMWLVFGLPPIAPFAASLLSWGCRTLGPWRWVAGGLLVAVVFYLALATTNMAYHVRNAYKDLPDLNWAAEAGIIWALVLTLPSLIGFAVRYQVLSSAVLGGVLLAILSSVFLIQGNLAFILFLSFE